MTPANKEKASPLSVADSPIECNFKCEIEEICGENVLQCYQCGECTAGCPAAFAMDLQPNQIMRMAQNGLKEDVLESSAIWLCAGCETCATRCPKDVALSKVMDACRQMAVESGKKPKEKNVVTFHKEFLGEVERNGRVHELTMIGLYKMKTLDFFSDVISGIQMFLKGKLGLIPHRVKGQKEVKKLIEESKKHK